MLPCFQGRVQLPSGSPSQGTVAFFSYYSQALKLGAAPLDSVPKNLLGFAPGRVPI